MDKTINFYQNSQFKSFQVNKNILLESHSGPDISFCNSSDEIKNISPLYYNSNTSNPEIDIFLYRFFYRCILNPTFKH